MADIAPGSKSASSLSGLTEEQAKEFHEQFKVSFTAFMALAALAHVLVLAGAGAWWGVAG